MPQSVLDEQHMRQALQLARLGQGAVEPNPMVGAVVLDAHGQQVGEGYHQRFGGPHAEVHALAQAGEAARGGTLYVTLEPCCHHGKTPPCTDAVLRAGLRRVVVAMADPFPRVAGGGLQLLRQAGLTVQVGLLEAEAQALNAPYLKLLLAGTPWVIGKWAMTLDGKIATRTGDSQWISNEQSRAKVHELRGRVDAILVGSGTVRADDPRLTARPAGPRTATRVVLSHRGQLPADCQLIRTAGEVPVLVYTRAEVLEQLDPWRMAGAEIVPVPATDATLSVSAILQDLGRRRFTNILLEGGAGLLGSFLDDRVMDEAWIFLGPKLVGGAAAPGPIGGSGFAKLAEAMPANAVQVEALGQDVWIRAQFTRQSS